MGGFFSNWAIREAPKNDFYILVIKGDLCNTMFNKCFEFSIQQYNAYR